MQYKLIRKIKLRVNNRHQEKKIKKKVIALSKLNLFQSLNLNLFKN